MKNILIFTLLLNSLVAFGQDNYFGWDNPKKPQNNKEEIMLNLKVQEDEIVWQKVYNKTLSAETIMSYLQNSGKVEDIAFFDNIISCNLIVTPFEYAAVGFKRSNIPMYLELYDFSAFIRVQVKLDGYRVTVSNIVMEQNQDTSLGKMGEKEKIETFAIKRGELSGQAIKFIDPVLTAQFDKLFNFESKILDEDW